MLFLGRASNMKSKLPCPCQFDLLTEEASLFKLTIVEGIVMHNDTDIDAGQNSSL